PAPGGAGRSTSNAELAQALQKVSFEPEETQEIAWHGSRSCPQRTVFIQRAQTVGDLEVFQHINVDAGGLADEMLERVGSEKIAVAKDRGLVAHIKSIRHTVDIRQVLADRMIAVGPIVQRFIFPPEILLQEIGRK